MRTLQEKYKAILEGTFSKEQFLRDARLQLPDLVTRFNGYEDAVQILKNRGMIQEIIQQVKIGRPGNTAEVKKGDKATIQGMEVTITNIERGKIVAKKDNGDMVYGKPMDFLPIKKDTNEARLTKNSLTDYRYKPTNEMDKYPYEQILRGLRVELEGMNVADTPTPQEYTKALGKVLKNLEKDEIFYTNQLAGVKKGSKRSDEMVPVTKTNTVDSLNAMKKAELKEGIKHVIKSLMMGESFDDSEDYERHSRHTEYSMPEDPEDVYDMFHDNSEEALEKSAAKTAQYTAEETLTLTDILS